MILGEMFGMLVYCFEFMVLNIGGRVGCQLHRLFLFVFPLLIAMHYILVILLK